eukprot:jgi/Mesvir1/2426/Mv22161-RA.1
MAVKCCSERWAELTSGSMRLALKAVDTDEHCSGGKLSPILAFEVEDMNTTVTKLLSLGAELQSPIQYKLHGKGGSWCEALSLYIAVMRGTVVGILLTSGPRPMPRLAHLQPEVVKEADTVCT